MTKMETLRIPPNAPDAEQNVLGALMIRGELAATVAEKLTEADFYQQRHGLIYRALLALSAEGKPCDFVIVSEWLERNGLTDKTGGESYLIEIANNTASAANVAIYADIVRERSARRKVIDLSMQLGSAAYDLGSTDLIDSAISELMGLQKFDTQHEFTLRQAMSAAYKAAQSAAELHGAIPGIPSGIRKLDEILGGWHAGDLIVIGARPSMGKTALLLNFAVAGRVPCGIISAEQPAVQMGARVLSIESKVEANKMRNGKFLADDLQQLAFAVQRLIEKDCMIFDRAAPNIAEVSRMARKWKQQNGIQALFVDYIQRIEGTDRREKKYERVGEVTRTLKNLARDLDIPVIALCQVGRHVDKEKDKRPNMGDMSDSSEIEKEADQILTLYRDEVYNDDTPDKGIAEINVEKNRHGPTGFVKCAWLAETMRFKDLGYDN